MASIILDPIFIFGLGMGVRGAALATIISQFFSAVWIVRFLTGKRTILRLRLSCLRPQWKRIRAIVGLGMSGFTMAITNCTVQIVCNATLQTFGGSLCGRYDSHQLPAGGGVHAGAGVTNSAQPVMGFNYGAKEYGRVKKAIVFTSLFSIAYTTLAWAFLHGFPEFFIRIFNQDQALIEAGVPALRLYFFGFFMMSLQFAGQAVFVALGMSRQAIFFSIFRKVVIVVPLTLLLPSVSGMGTNGVFLAEPISNFIGGAACFGTMLLLVWTELTRRERAKTV